MPPDCGLSCAVDSPASFVAWGVKASLKQPATTAFDMRKLWLSNEEGALGLAALRTTAESMGGPHGPPVHGGLSCPTTEAGR